MFYKRFKAPLLTTDDLPPHDPARSARIDALTAEPCRHGDARDMSAVPDGCVALVVTSPPYFVGKEYELGSSADYSDHLRLLEGVFAECVRVLEPGGRIAVNVANLGRKPYRSLSSDVTQILVRLGLLLRGEIIWHKGRSAQNSCAWGSFRRASNPTLRDTTERVIVASKGRFDRARDRKRRMLDGLPSRSTLSTDEFIESTLDLWTIPPEFAHRVGHPAPFPPELPRRLINLYSYEGDLVLDPFMGSGTTLVAAQQTLRRAIGFDTDAAYVQMARDRLATAERPQPSLLRHDIAVRSGNKAHDIAAGMVTAAGFRIIADTAAIPGTGVEMSFKLTDRSGREWWAEVAGGFTTTQPGLARHETVMSTVAKAAALAGAIHRSRLLVITPYVPPPKSTSSIRVLRAAGPRMIYDVAEIFDEDSERRLLTYALGTTEQPLTGFWPGSGATGR